ncbi:MAG: InlB B-repeat-containing protein, partial [Eubacteriales bacterium]|nr:InlB B-repeat-containing protein [Eubacteriales bacterium]
FNTAITKDTTVYAKWRCQVTFYTNHGTAPAAQIVDIGATATKPTDLSWIGYKWGGWCSDDDWKNAFDFKTPIMSNTFLYAEWIPDLKVTKGDGGTAHYGSTYAFTLNYYYPDYNKNSTAFKLYIGRHNSSTASEISKSHYVVTQGADKRAVVTLKASYIRTLTDGATYDIIFDTGLGPYDYDASKYPPIDLGATEGTFKVSKSPKTGDESNVALWAAIAGVSLIAVVVIAVVLLNKRKKGKKAPTPPETRPADKTRKPPKE